MAQQVEERMGRISVHVRDLFFESEDRGGRGGKAGKGKMMTLADMERASTQSACGGETVNGWSPDGSAQW